jgi:RNA polymerase sigma-70 factor (ECF subfamily)
MPDDSMRLVRLAAGGDAAAFEEIVRMHQQAVYGVVRGIAGNPHDADDATQEAFIRAHRRLKGFRGESSLRTWITAIAVNAAHDLLRRRRLLGLLPLGRRHEETLAAAGPGPEEGLMARQLGARVADFAARQLSERERAVFSLRFSGGHSIEEIARIVSASPSTVKTHLYRALAKARRCLGPGGQEGGR